MLPTRFQLFKNILAISQHCLHALKKAQRSHHSKTPSTLSPISPLLLSFRTHSWSFLAVQLHQTAKQHCRMGVQLLACSEEVSLHTRAARQSQLRSIPSQYSRTADMLSIVPALTTARYLSLLSLAHKRSTVVCPRMSLGSSLTNSRPSSLRLYTRQQSSSPAICSRQHNASKLLRYQSLALSASSTFLFRPRRLLYTVRSQQDCRYALRSSACYKTSRAGHTLYSAVTNAQ